MWQTLGIMSVGARYFRNSVTMALRHVHPKRCNMLLMGPSSRAISTTTPRWNLQWHDESRYKSIQHGRFSKEGDSVSQDICYTEKFIPRQEFQNLFDSSTIKADYICLLNGQQMFASTVERQSRRIKDGYISN